MLGRQKAPSDLELFSFDYSWESFVRFVGTFYSNEADLGLTSSLDNSLLIKDLF